MRILLAIDGSDYSKKMLAYMSAHESLFSAAHDYTLLNVQAALPGRARTLLGKETVERYYATEAEKVLSTASKFLLRHAIDAKSITKVGHAAQTIAKIAEQGKYDLLVMGSHGTGALMKLVMGSVATEVLAHCKVPVLLVR